MPELTEQDFDRALTRSRRLRFIAGEFPSGKDIADLRAFVGLSQPQFASALGISVHTLRGWEQGRRRPHGPGIALLRIAARHPKMIRENSVCPT